MAVTTASDARKNLFGLLRQVNDDSDTVTITSRGGNAVLVGEAEWASIQETLFVASMPGAARLAADIAKIRAGDLSDVTEHELVDPDTIR